MRRRALLAAGAVGALTLAGCGRVRLGGPAEYTPPPPGIDDLYRSDLLAAMDLAIAGTEHVDGSGETGSPGLSAALTSLADALPTQRTALLTGAEAEKEREASENPDPDADASAPPADPPADVTELIAVLVELRDLAADAARQVSGSLARPVCAIGAHTTWIAHRLQAAAGQGDVPAGPSAQEIEPARPVPQTDPPSIGAESDFHLTIETAQEQEWYAGYVREVLASRTEEGTRQSHLDAAEQHRDRAAELGGIAEAEGAPVVARQAAYSLPGGTMDEQTAGAMPTQLEHAVMVSHIALAGAAPFTHRSLSIAAAYGRAAVLGGLVDRLEPMPSLEVAEDVTRQGSATPE